MPGCQPVRLAATAPFMKLMKRTYSTSAKDIADCLSRPTWSVRSLLPSLSSKPTAIVNEERLHHLLRLSALPRPQGSESKNKMLEALNSQLHFVNEIRKVDTRGVTPLCSLRSETEADEKEREVTMHTVKDALANEEQRGVYHKRFRRKTNESTQINDSETWDVLGSAQKKIDQYFVVESSSNGPE
jgi:Asp-tRNA(Asn)/Glu-tRNA(Gln) amidotransferase C subunit